jgi:hypothetical protein
MPDQTVYTLAASKISISGGGELSGYTQGNGSHLSGLTITLNTNSWTAVDIVDSNSSFQDSDSNQTLKDTTQYDGVTYASGSRVESEYSLTLQDPDGNTYKVLAFNINEPGVTSFATVEGLAFVGGPGGFPPIGVPLTVIATNEGPSDPYSSLATPVCFTRGTVIETANGPRLIEDLSCGDLVRTMSDGFQPIRWVGSMSFSAAALRHNPALLPIRITAGALGQGLPLRDLIVSRQHRFLAASRVVQRLFDTNAVLVPVHKLTALDGIYVDESRQHVEYFHILFDCHQVIFAEGAPTESLFTGPEALKAVSNAARAEILAIFPELMDMSYTLAPALPVTKGKKQNRLVDRHIRNDKPILETYYDAHSEAR